MDYKYTWRISTRKFIEKFFRVEVELTNLSNEIKNSSKKNEFFDRVKS